MFAFVGAKFKRPLLVGLIFMFGWEQIALAVPGYLKKFTVMYYLQAMVPHAMPKDGLSEPGPGILPADAVPPRQPGVAGVILLVVYGGATRIVERKEYVLEQ